MKFADTLRRRGARFWLLAAASACLGVALFDPAGQMERRVGTYLMVFDITQSMNTRDVGPADVRIGRLDYAKQL
ncbi:UNVERIFIED_CONTAM: hypothetical protein IGO34_30570, partial [Salmonella enterica subsp. enterica serovar Weltevreden]